MESIKSMNQLETELGLVKPLIGNLNPWRELSAEEELERYLTILKSYNHQNKPIPSKYFSLIEKSISDLEKRENISFVDLVSFARTINNNLFRLNKTEEHNKPNQLTSHWNSKGYLFG